ncbi:uncharacterized protein LOC132299969 [Cornus florida]|uniref:uncharacterized protein LOC132299969 n=1 Tax=Cornus florida TaxID=4283 RepID=UPI002897B3AF|nr:uncharacterized protein LOC132299969 [Cornus florida]
MKFADRIRENSEIKIASLGVAVNSQYGIEPSRMQLYRANRKALEEIGGNHAEAYTLLPAYANEIDKTNPGSLAKIKRFRANLFVNPVFSRIFICFEALATGLKKGCRPFIGLDGCHLKGPYGGVLLAATALDGNNGLFPVAYGVVESEGRESWGFFLTHLQTMIGKDFEDNPWTFMSDQQKGLDSAISYIFPKAHHRYCCRHLFNNFKKKYLGLLLRKYFWRAARAYNQADFDIAMGHLRNLTEEGYNNLMELPVSSWSRHGFDENVKNDHVTNN